MKSRTYNIPPPGFPTYAFFPEWVTVYLWFLAIAGTAGIWYAWRTGNLEFKNL